MPRIKKATDASGNVFYPATISKAVWDIDNNQRLSVTIAGKQDLIDSSNKLSADLITDGTTNKVINVKPDWNAASGDAAEILNKPTIPSYNTFGASGTNHSSGLVPDPGATQGTTKYLREDGTWAVPEGGSSVQSDWEQDDSTADDFIKNKPTIPTVPDLSKGTTTGSGNAVTDISVSGHKITLTKGSTFLTSHQDISGKEDKMTISVKSNGTSMTAAVGNYYRFTYNVGTLAITLPTLTNSKARFVLFFLTTGTSPNVTFTSSSNTIYKSDGFSIDASTTYEINALWNGNAWVINAVKYTT